MGLITETLSTWRQYLRPASREEATGQLQRMVATARKEKISGAEWGVRFAEMLENLEDCPIDIIRECRKRWFKKEIFFPANAQFLDLVGPLLGDRKRELKCLKILLSVADNPAPDGIVTKEWWNEIQRDVDA